MNIFLFQATAVPSQAATTQSTAAAPVIADVPVTNPQKQSAWGSIGFMVLLFAVLYFLMIRPNQKKEKQRKEKLASLVDGDKIVTIGGIKGTIVSVKDDSVIIRSKGTEIEMVKAAISHIVR